MGKKGEIGLPIDHGWAWVITFSSCGLFAFVSGNFKCQGIILVELLERFPKESAKSLLWIFSISEILNKTSGPLCGFILSKTSNRTLSMMGVCLISLTLIIFAHLPQTGYMYPIYGVGYGLGNGMVSLSVYTAYAPYFHKRKALSLGISTGGSGVGTMLIPNVLRMLFDNFSFSGAILLYAGVCLQTLVLASLLRPMEYYERLVELKHARISRQQTEQRQRSQLEKPLGSELYAIGDENTVQDRSLLAGDREQEQMTPTNEQTSEFHISEHTETEMLSKKAHHDKGKLSVNLSDSKQAPISHERSDSADHVDADVGERKAGHKSFNWRLAYNPKSVLIGLTTLCFASGICVVYQCIPSLGKEAGVSKQLIAIAMATCGILEIPARIGHGWLADRKYVSVFTHLALCMFITGSAALFCATISGRAGIVTLLVALASVGMPVYSLMPIAVGGALGVENVGSGMAINFFYQGVGTIIGTFGAGAIYDKTRIWENVFYFIGTSTLTSCSIMLATAVITFVRLQRQESSNKER